MPKKVPTLGYPSLAVAISALRAKGMDTQAIADATGRTCNHVTATEYRLTQAKRPRTLIIEERIFDKLQRHASRRGMNAVELADQLLATIARDNLVEAVLDDGGHL